MEPPSPQPCWTAEDSANHNKEDNNYDDEVDEIDDDDDDSTTSIVILPPGGPIGLQLEDVEDPTTTTSSTTHPPQAHTPPPMKAVSAARVVRWVDGGPRRPGLARASGRIHPGDGILQVQIIIAEQEEGAASAAAATGTTTLPTVVVASATDYTEMLHILQQYPHGIRKLTVRSLAKCLLRNSSNCHPRTKQGEEATTTAAAAEVTMATHEKFNHKNYYHPLMLHDQRRWQQQVPQKYLIHPPKERVHHPLVATTTTTTPGRTLFGTNLKAMGTIQFEPWPIQSISFSASIHHQQKQHQQTKQNPFMTVEGESPDSTKQRTTTIQSWELRAWERTRRIPAQVFDGMIAVPKVLTFSKPSSSTTTPLTVAVGENVTHPRMSHKVALDVDEKRLALRRCCLVRTESPQEGITSSGDPAGDATNPIDATHEDSKPTADVHPMVKKEPGTVTTLLLNKAASKHQLSLARLRVKRQYEQQDNVDFVIGTSPPGAKRSASPTEGQVPVFTLETPTHTDVSTPTPANSSTTTVVREAPSTIMMIDFSHFSQEQTICFEPGPVGMQLEPVTQNGPGDVYAATIVRFVDGGPHNPGQARASGRLRPGDFVIRVEAEGVVGTSYYTVLHLLQKSWTTRTLTFRPAWDPSRMVLCGGSIPPVSSLPPLQRTGSVGNNPHEEASKVVPNSTPSNTTPSSGTLLPALRRSSPLKESNPLPYDWTPLPYDWVYKRPLPPEQERQQIYRLEVERLVHEARARKEKEQRDQGVGDHWDFGNVLISAVALSAESVAGCLRQNRGSRDHDDDDDDDVYYEQSDSHEKWD